MSITTVETTFRDKGEFMKRCERKHTKASMARVMADIHWILTDDKLSDEGKIKALKDAHHQICWG